MFVKIVEEIREIMQQNMRLVNGLKSYRIYTDADSGVKLYSLQTVLVAYYGRFRTFLPK